MGGMGTDNSGDARQDWPHWHWRNSQCFRLMIFHPDIFYFYLTFTCTIFAFVLNEWDFLAHLLCFYQNNSTNVSLFLQYSCSWKITLSNLQKKCSVTPTILLISRYVITDNIECSSLAGKCTKWSAKWGIKVQIVSIYRYDNSEMPFPNSSGNMGGSQPVKKSM